VGAGAKDLTWEGAKELMVKGKRKRREGRGGEITGTNLLKGKSLARI
jgi:hypothetical protein